ncbi:MAG: AAA family ATPase [Pasteurella sp.]|nr:AAA family ATPase [Pasteurella sp.]
MQQFITFLKEYNKLLERGVGNIFTKSHTNNFIWADDIQQLKEQQKCESIVLDIFSKTIEVSANPNLLKLEKYQKPEIIIPHRWKEYIGFDEAKNIFFSIDGNIDKFNEFLSSKRGKTNIRLVEDYQHHKNIYSKLFRAYNDIRNDSNSEIVLSVGLIQFTKLQHNEKISKTNQHLFHFPLSISIDAANKIIVSFSDKEPYIDTFFFNNTPIDKENLSNIVDRFEQKIQDNGFEYLFSQEFATLIKNDLQQISENSSFESEYFLLKPQSDECKERNHFRISFSPAINIKQIKPRFFQKLMDNIIVQNDSEEMDNPLLDLMIRKPNTDNILQQPHYFKDNFYNEYAKDSQSLEQDDFSEFFPLPANKEQTEIYKKYLNNRLTVVTGPPGTGKSHTIVNLLCSLLAEGKRVLVTAQTDKALESLLDKVPEVFDDLIFTKIQLETNKNRFSLENSIDNLSDILKNDFNLNIPEKINKLDELKSEYVALKRDVIQALEKEYEKLKINNSFNDLRAYKIVEKFEQKDKQEWVWITDNIGNEQLEKFDDIRSIFIDYQSLKDTPPIIHHIDFDWDKFLINYDVVKSSINDYYEAKQNIFHIKQNLGIDDNNKQLINNIDIDKVLQELNDFINEDIIIPLANKNHLKRLDKNLDEVLQQIANTDITTNKDFSDLVSNNEKYRQDIQMYLSLIKENKETIGFLTKRTKKVIYQTVQYLETIILNGTPCNNRESLLALESYLEKIITIQMCVKDLTKYRFDMSIISENSSILKKKEELQKVLEVIQKNKKILSIVGKQEYDTIFNFFKLENNQIDELKQSLIQNQEQILTFKKYNCTISRMQNLKENIKNIITGNKYFENIVLPCLVADNFETLQEEIDTIAELRKKEIQLQNISQKLKQILPNSFDRLKDLPQAYFTKENFEFAQANNVLIKNKSIDLQNHKETIADINKQIFRIKCEILYDLAKSNFKKRFDKANVSQFINLLNKYQTNLTQANRKTKKATQFQRLVRKNSQEISGKLSCWVMKFNDVLDSVDKKPNVFDCIIVDEASQLDFTSLILGYYSHNIIVVGDDKQTAPGHLTGADGDSFDGIVNKYLDYMGDEKLHIRSDISLFELSDMVAGGANVSLKEHFRCVPEIIEFSKHHFYNDQLRPLKQLNGNRLQPKLAIYVEGAYREKKIVTKEIEAIKQQLDILFNDEQYDKKSIGVVSLGTSEHTKNLKEIISEFDKETIEKHKLIIEDATKFQGDERDVMFISLGVALEYENLQNNKNAKPSAIITDRAEKRKINVALSRAKEQMILFHSVQYDDLQKNDFRNEIIKFFYEEYCEIEDLIIKKDNIQRNRHNVLEPFDSWFEIDVANDLIQAGFPKIQPQYKVKEDETFYNPREGKEVYVNFKLDLVVHHNGKRVAIECDGDPFHSLPEDVAYDIERQEFLERVGWKVYRILYSAYKRNPEQEIQKAVEFIERHTQ